ncbi:hypothetical protein RRF57_010194 [Xylaria bambusicola]|uniref:Mitochondrial carrier protein n=1 Tax=Xylaria bambusicola TaxID=326684 RepID=A0AAN7UXW3_9PEZI
MLAGASAAFVVDMIVYPLDTLKTRQQSQGFLRAFVDPSTKTWLPSRQLFRGLYQGIGIVVVATLPAAGTFFTVYEASKSFLGRHGSSVIVPQLVVHSGASAIAESEVIKQNAQMLQRHESNRNGKSARKFASPQALRQLGGADGGRRLPYLLRLYSQRAVALVARNLPFTAIQFPIFEFLRTRIWRRHPPGNGDARVEGNTEIRSLFETGLVTGTSAGLAGSFAAAITTPTDVVKTRLMLAAGSSEQDSGQARIGKEGGMPKYHAWGGLAVAREVLAEKGIVGLFRGAILQSVWTAVGSGLYLRMYEVAKICLARGR